MGVVVFIVKKSPILDENQVQMFPGNLTYYHFNPRYI